MSRKSRRERAAKETRPQSPTPAPQPPASSPRSSLRVAVLLGLGVLVIGSAAFAVYHFRDRPTVTREPSSGSHPVVMETSEGTIKIELFEKDSPITVKNFLTYVDEQFYDGTIFHRVIPKFMIQGGGFEPGLRRKQEKRPTIENEARNGLSNRRGTLAMARTDQPDSASSEFFINLVDNRGLDRNQAQDGVGYTVFGRVTQGMDVVDRIAKVPTGTREGHKAVPFQDVVIQSVRRVDSPGSP